MQSKTFTKGEKGATPAGEKRGNRSSLALAGATELDQELLEKLFTEYFIGREFIDFSGNTIVTPARNRLTILNCMGVRIDSNAELEALLKEKELARLSRPLEFILLGEENTTVTLGIRIQEKDLGLTHHWLLTLEDGFTRQGEFQPLDLPETGSEQSGELRIRTASLDLGIVPVGYHRVQLTTSDAAVQSDLIVAPRATWQPPALHESRRMWGLSTQLYTLRSDSNWGIGEFSDLKELCALAAGQKADFILLNPLHYPDLRYPDNASPYSPDDRRFINPLYIHLPWCEDFEADRVCELVASADFREDLATARNAAAVDYALVTKLKLKVLELMYLSFRERFITDLPYLQFQHFCKQGGGPLAGFARLQAERHARTGATGSDPDFHCYLQWLAQSQLEECQQHARDQGMQIGVIQDLAVGSIPEGSEIRTNPAQYSLQARIGAPPDYFNPEGQNWGLPPLQPDTLLKTGCSHIRNLLRASMKGCGALRIDHVMSLMRLWWCPDEGSNANGAYVYYPVDALFAILRLESVRNRCSVIGEDLGVVPPEIRPYLDNAGIFSNSLFYFEKYDGWHFRKPEHYKPHSLAMMTNHDVPPLLCWWSEADLAIRRRIGLVKEEKYEDELNWRRGEKGQILCWLQEQGLLPDSWSPQDTARELDDELRTALCRAYGGVNASLVSLQLDDLAGADLPINIPGTHTEYANWRRKIPLDTSTIFNSSIALRMMQAMCEGRGT